MSLPAWSEQFAEERLRSIPPVLPRVISREWAFAGATGRGVRVAIVDSGIDASHPAVGTVQGGVALEYDAEAPSRVRMVEGPHDDLFGHGTACAGIIRAIAPDCELYSVRVLGARLTGKGPVFAAGIRWAVENGMHVANLSLSTGKPEYYSMFHEVADVAYFRNLMLVCAVNNLPGPTYPSEYSSVFSVAAHTGRDPMHWDYNPSPPVEFGAPGISVDVAWMDGSTITASGNSFAAPHISGIVALVLSKHPGLTPFEMKTVLAALADNRMSPSA
ncbi:MAG TPA: S8 family serine peptidase [Candidatus Dormibacteraeota bacterium]|nr:S8 family serine peptidase [Candidatus Dormibacteraeota bacterium]